MKFSRLSVLPLVLALRFLVVPLAAQDTWEWRSPSPTGNRLTSFAHGHGLFVGVGESGAIATSPDGATWINRTSGVFENLIRVVFDGARFVAVSPQTILTSADGAVWTSQPAPAAIRDLASGNGTLVALIAGATATDPTRFLVSSDGAAWTIRANPTNWSPNILLFSNGIFVAADHAGHVLRSTDALTWTPVTVAPAGTNTAVATVQGAAGDGIFLVAFAGTPYRSTDGLVWTSGLAWNSPYQPGTSSPLYVANLGFANGRFYLDEGHGGHGVFTSADALTWAPLGFYADQNQRNLYYLDFSTLASGGGTVVATENEDFYAGFGNPHRSYVHYSSTSGLPTATGWSEIAFKASNHFTLTYGLGRFFANGQSSPDGQSWSDCGFAPTHAAGDRLFRLTSVYSYPVEPTQVSSDGLTATAIDVQMPAPRSVAFGAGRYVVVGDGGKISTSTDALAWATTPSGTTSKLNAVLYAFDRFIAVGAAGTLLTSPDGLTWTDQSTAALAGLTLDGLAASPDRLLVTSSVASTAAPASLTLTGNVPVSFAVNRGYSSAIYFNGAFLALSPGSTYFPQTNAQLWKSADGLAWTEVPIPVQLLPYSDFLLASGNGLALFFARIVYTLNGGSYTAVLAMPTSPPAVAPVIVAAPLAKTIHRGESASFAVDATGAGPFSYQWFRNGTTLPGATQSILTFNLTTEVAVGDYTVVVANSAGSVTSASAHLAIDPPLPLAITQPPTGGQISDGQSLRLQVTVTGSGPITYQWRHDGRPISSATSPTYDLHGSQLAPEWSVGVWDVVVTAPYSTVTSAGVAVIWADASFPAPTIRHAPASEVVRPGSVAALSIDVSDYTFYAFQWRHDGVAIPGATSTTLWVHDFSAADAGTYDVVIRSPDFTTTISPAATLTYGWSRLANLSALGFAGTGEETFLQGFVLAGTCDDPAAGPLVRSVGPGLIPLGVENVLPDPTLTLLSSAHATVATNDNWATPPTLDGLPATAAAMSALGAFALDPTSLDSALQLPASHGGLFLVQTSGARGSTGYVLNEIYAPDTPTLHLVNLSARSRVGDRPLIAGFVIVGTQPLRVLIRGVGPTLAAQGVRAPLAHPRITLYRGSSAIATNDRWGQAPYLVFLRSATTHTGAFPLDEGSDDAALYETLEPGVYSVHVTSTDGASGIALVEIYEAE